MGNEETKEFKPWPKWLLFGGALVLWVGITWFFSQYDKPNEIGDSFGAVNALFSGLAFAGLIVTIQQQHEELKETRIEMGIQSAHLAAQSKQMNLQAQLMALSTSLSVQPEIIRRLVGDLEFKFPNLYREHLMRELGVKRIEDLIETDGKCVRLENLRDDNSSQESVIAQTELELKEHNSLTMTRPKELILGRKASAQQKISINNKLIREIKDAQDDLTRLKREVKQLFLDKRKLEDIQKQAEGLTKQAESDQ